MHIVQNGYGMSIKLSGSLAKSATKNKLAPHLDRVIGEGDFEWTYTYSPKIGDDGWHPSGDCTPSLRDLYLKAKGELAERPISTSLYKTFQVGHFFHAYVQHLVVEKLQFCDWDAIERTGTKKWNDDPYGYATGSGDIAPITLPTHGELLVDMKTMNAHDFRGHSLPAWTKDKWECQVNIYMDFFDLDRAIILGIMKDSPHDFKEFFFPKNQELVDAIYKKWELVSECLANNIEPPADEEVYLPLKGCR